jgi:DNA end-binding protein Ku
MARSIWNGTVTFGLIDVPVQVSSATEDRTIHFHQVHATDGARIKQHRICSKEDREVPYEEVAKGYEVDDGEYVLLTPEEIAAAGGESEHRIALDEFVCAPEIDPVFYERTYYLGAGREGEAAYRLLHDALAKAGRVGIGRWVFHNREYLVAVRAMDGVLALHTMRFAEELVDPGELELPAAAHAPGKRELEMAGQLVDSLQGDSSPGDFEDTYRERLLALIERKAAGEEIEAPAVEEPEAGTDLMAALEASLAEHGSRRSSGSKRSGSQRPASGRRSGSGSRARSRSRGGH